MKTIIIHTENKNYLQNTLVSLSQDFNKLDCKLFLHSKNYVPWLDEYILNEITSYQEYYAYPTNKSITDSVIELVSKSKTDDIIIIDENPNTNKYIGKKSDFLKSNLDTKYKSLDWFLVDVNTQIDNRGIPMYFFIPHLPNEDSQRYFKKIDNSLFNERIIYIDGGLGDHIMALPLLEKLQNNIHICCKYPFIFDHLSVKGYVDWLDDLFGGYSRFVYEYGSSNNSQTIIDAFFGLYNETRTESDILIYRGKRSESSPISIENSKVVLICTSAAKIQNQDSNKDWKDVRWMNLVYWLKKEGYFVIQVGTTKDNQIPNVHFKFLDRPISELAWLIDNSALWISVDTFFHHFASAIKPDVGICLTPFYNDHAKHTGVTYIEKDCGKNYWDRRWWMDLQQPERKECMDMIQVEDVIQCISSIKNKKYHATNTKKINSYENNQYVGWVSDSSSPHWWLDENCKNSFEFFDLEGFYNTDYFSNDHVNETISKNYVDYVAYYYELLTQKKLHSVLEIGSAGGWFTKRFKDEGYEIFGVEGSECGYEACIKRGINKNEILKHDLRHPLKLNKRYDIVCCTEVAEHIEMPFSGTLIKTLVDNSDIVWFSSVAPGFLGIPPTYDHPNEQSEKFWINLFKFFGYDYYKLPDEVYNNTQLRGRYLFYNKSLYSMN